MSADAAHTLALTSMKRRMPLGALRKPRGELCTCPVGGQGRNPLYFQNFLAASR
jgi:hypothetical protein